MFSQRPQATVMLMLMLLDVLQLRTQENCKVVTLKYFFAARTI